jgi:hypothetical protein
MNTKILFPRWDSLSLEQKTAFKEWVKSVLRFKESNKNLINAFNLKNENKQVLSTEDVIVSSKDWEIVSAEENSDGMRVEDFIKFVPETPIDDVFEVICKVKCVTDSDPDCVNKCLRKLK